MENTELLECPECHLQTRWRDWDRCILCTPCPFPRGECDGHSCTVCSARGRFEEERFNAAAAEADIDHEEEEDENLRQAAIEVKEALDALELAHVLRHDAATVEELRRKVAGAIALLAGNDERERSIIERLLMK